MPPSPSPIRRLLPPHLPPSHPLTASHILSDLRHASTRLSPVQWAGLRMLTSQVRKLSAPPPVSTGEYIYLPTQQRGPAHSEWGGGCLPVHCWRLVGATGSRYAVLQPTRCDRECWHIRTCRRPGQLLPRPHGSTHHMTLCHVTWHTVHSIVIHILSLHPRIS